MERPWMLRVWDAGLTLFAYKWEHGAAVKQRPLV